MTRTCVSRLEDFRFGCKIPQQQRSRNKKSMIPKIVMLYNKVPRAFRPVAAPVKLAPYGVLNVEKTR